MARAAWANQANSGKEGEGSALDEKLRYARALDAVGMEEGHVHREAARLVLHRGIGPEVEEAPYRGLKEAVSRYMEDRGPRQPRVGLP